MNCYFVGIMYGRSCTKLRADRTSNMYTTDSSCFLFVIGQFKKKSLDWFLKHFLLWNRSVKWTKICRKRPRSYRRQVIYIKAPSLPLLQIKWSLPSVLKHKMYFCLYIYCLNQFQEIKKETKLAHVHVNKTKSFSNEICT